MTKQKTSIVDVEGCLHFEHMTKAQKNAMNHVAFDGHATNTIPSKTTLQSLVDNGLIEKQEKCLGRDCFGPILVDDYVMPIAVHMAWCAFVSEAA